MKRNFNIELLTKNIICLCRKRNVSVNRMLKECDLNKSVVDNLKKGIPPTIDKVAAIADYFNVSVDNLLKNNQFPTGEKEVS